MARVRFATAKDLFDTFPTAGTDVGVVDAGDMRSIDFLLQLAGRGDFRAALSFCAYLLARREAVWWGCQSLRKIALEPGEGALIDAADRWVREPDDDRRRQALDLGSKGDTSLAGCWICLGAGWAGGTIKADAEHSVPVPSHATAQAVRVGMILAAGRLEAEAYGPTLRRWIDAGAELAQAGGKG